MALGDIFDKKTIRGIDDTLIINDISLRVSPTQINITNRSLNYEWETLRTEGTHRAKSGHSTVSISMNIVFVGEEAINTTLRPLVAQLRLTPFCYVQNDHIRDSLFPGESGVTGLARDSADQETIALAFRSCTLEVDPQTAPITVQGLFEFTYFNYKPYSPYFEFKKDMADIALPSGGVAGHTPFPWESAPWKAFYAPRVQRTKPLVEKFAAKAEIIFPEYRVTSTDTAQNLESEIKILNELGGPTPDRFLEAFANNIGADLAATIQQAGVLSGALTPEDTIGSAETLLGVLRDASPRFQQQRNDIQHSVTSDRTGYSNLIVQEQILAAISLVQNKIRGVQDLTESIDKFEKVPELSSDKVGGMGTFKRLRKVELLVEQGIVIVNIRVQIRNSLATLPIVGHRYATLQHMGSRDAIVDIDTMCTTEAANKRLAWFYTTVEEGILKNKKLPHGAQVIQVDNDFLRLFDLQYFITQDHSSDTIPGEPGTYATTIRLVESAVKPTTRLESEEFRSEYASNDSELQNRLVKIALEQVTFSTDQQRFVVRHGLGQVKDQAFRKSIEELLHHFNTFLKGIDDLVDLDPDALSVIGSVGSAFYATKEEQVPGIVLIQRAIAGDLGASPSRTLTPAIRQDQAELEHGEDFVELDRASVERRDRENRNRYNLGDASARTRLREEGRRDSLTDLSIRPRARPMTVQEFMGSLEVNNWFLGINSWASGILSSSKLVIQQYAPVYNEVAKTGFRKGRPAYPDFDLKIIADAIAVPETSIDPDFYFFSPIRDTISGVVDPMMVDIAKTVALEGYNSIKTEMTRYFKDGWLGKFSDDTADDFIKLAEDGVLNHDSGGPREMEVDDGDTWENGGQQASKVSTKKRPAAPIVIEPDMYGTDEKVSMNDRTKRPLAPAGTVTHTASPSRLFDGVAATTGAGGSAAASSPSGGAASLDVAYTDPTFAGGQRTKPPLGHMEQMSPFGKERTKDTFGNTIPGGGTRPHKGLDLKAREGTPVFAIADGIVLTAKRIINPDGKRNAAGVAVILGHSDGSKSKYFHLKNGDLKVKAGDNVKAGQQIALSGTTSHKMTDTSMGPHLHLEMWDAHNRPLNPARYFPVIGDTSMRQRATSGAALGPGTGASAQISVLKASIEQFEKSLKNGQAFRMARAFPTFKLYFIEDDSEDRRRFGADDFFSYNSVRSIRVVRSRKIAADLMVIEVTNISGNLTSRKFSYEDPTKQQNTDTTKENPISKLVVQEGMDVELLLGYCVDDRTEILTKRGWLKHGELKESDTTLTLNHSTGLSEWQAIDKVHRFYLDDQPTILIKGEKHSSLTTLNHRWPVLRRTTVGGKRTLVREWTTSEKLNTGHIFIGGAKSSSPEKIWDDAFVELVAWFWTEGNIINKGQNCNPAIVLSQSPTANPKNVDRISAALTQLFGKPVDRLSGGRCWKKEPVPKWSKRKRRTRDEVNFRLNTTASKRFLEIAPDKVVSRDFIMQLTIDQLELFINISNKGDGHYSQQEKGPLLISQKDPRFLDALELAAILAGYRIRRYYAKYTYKDRQGREYHPDTLYISRKTNIWLDHHCRPKKTNYTGTVWCPSTKNQSWLARRDGLTYFTGNSNDPAKLTSVFVGKVMEVELNETEDLIVLTCQSHAIEMVQSIQGLEKPKRLHGWFLSTNEAATDVLLENLISLPEVVHFGRWERSKAVKQDTQTFRHVLQNKWSLKPNPQDDNIFINRARDARLDTGWLWSNLEFSIHQRTIWDIFQEMTLRHPGWIAQAVPYRDRFGPRMTMFFGLPGQLYFSRDPTLDELRMQEDIKESVRQDATAALEQALRDPSYRTKFRNFELPEGVFKGLLEKDQSREGLLDTIGTDPVRARLFAQQIQAFLNTPGQSNSLLKSLMVAAQRAMIVRREEELGREREIIRPFRKYHLLTSAHHIVYNNIRSSAKDSYNTVSILHGARKFNEKTEEFEATDDLDAFTLKVDAGLPDEEIRELLVSDYVNCNNEGLARRYAQALLADQLRNIYRGELVIVGNPDVQPNDICFVMDDYSDMVGPIEVDQVVHILSHETGFITEITPSMFVTTNEFANMTLSDAMGVYIEGATANMYSQIYGLEDPSHLLGGIGNTAGAGMMAAAGVRGAAGIQGAGGVGAVAGRIGAAARAAGGMGHLTASASAGITEGLGAAAARVGVGAGAAAAGTGVAIAAPFILAATAVGLWGWGLYSRRKILDFTNHAQPVFMHPLMHSGRPMLAGLPLRKLDNGWTTRHGKWSKDTAEGWGMLWEDFWDKVTWAPSQGNFSNIFSGSTVPPKF